MRVLLLSIFLTLIGCGENLIHPLYGGSLITEREGRRTTVWYCVGRIDNLLNHLDRTVPVQGLNRRQEMEMIFRQVTTRPGWACGWQTVFRVRYGRTGSYRGVPIIAVYTDNWRQPIGYTIRRQY